MQLKLRGHKISLSFAEHLFTKPMYHFPYSTLTQLDYWCEDKSLDLASDVRSVIDSTYDI